MKAIILAAGRGKRLKPLTDDIPKTLLEIDGKTILERSIGTLMECGINNIIIVAGYRAGQINAVAAGCKGANIEVVYNPDYENTDNMYSVMLCEKACADEPIIITMGDTLLSKEIIRASLSSKFSNVPVEMNTRLKDGQKVKIVNGVVRGISKTLADAQGTSITVYNFSKEDAIFLFKHISHIIHNEKRLNEWIEVAIHEISDKIIIKPIDIKSAFWMEIDDHEDLEKARNLLKIGCNNKNIY